MIRRRIDPATTDTYFQTPAQPTKAEVTAWSDNYAKGLLGELHKLLSAIPDGGGDAGIVEMRNLVAAYNVQFKKKADVYDAGAMRAALDTFIAGANRVEREAFAKLVPGTVDTTNSASALKQFNEVYDVRFGEVMAMVNSLDATALAKVNAEQQAAALAQTAARAACQPANYVDATARSALVDFAAKTAFLQQAAEKVMEASVGRTMKVGTELTFTHEAIHNLDPKTPEKCLNEWTAAIAFIKEWEQKVLENPLSLETKIYPVITRDPITEGGYKDDKTVPRFTYTFGQPARTWWWRLNVDPGCLEMQTDPMTKLDATADWDPGAAEASRVINTIIGEHIFAVANLIKKERVALAPHDLIGGGHLTLDAATTFRDNPRWFRNLLVLYTNDAVKWKAQDADEFNAPTVSELNSDGVKAFKRIIKQFDDAQKTAKPQSIADLTGNLTGQVFIAKYFTEGGTKANREKRAVHPAHYQATNIEHMAKDNPRLEMRRFDAQTSVEDLLADMGKLAKLVADARKPGLAKLTI